MLLLCCSGTWSASRFITLVGSTRSAPSYYSVARGLGVRVDSLHWWVRLGVPRATTLLLGDLECESIHYTGGFDSECPELLLCCSGTWSASRFTTLVGSTRSAPSYYSVARGLGVRVDSLHWWVRLGVPRATTLVLGDLECLVLL